MDIQKSLFDLQDEKYRAFHSRLMPGISIDRIIGVRVPDIRKLAKKYRGTEEAKAFLQELPHQYYDEDMLHGVMLSEMQDLDACLKEVSRFLPYIDNWAVCDIMSPKIFGKHKKELLAEIKRWAKSERVYECRFGIKMLMSHFLKEDFQAEYLEIPAQVHSEEYYVQMMIAWFFAEALVRQWDAAIPYIKENKLDHWVHNKTIQKARESYRITEEQKEYLKRLKR